MIKLGERYKNVTTKDEVTTLSCDANDEKELIVSYRKKEPVKLGGILRYVFSKPLRVFEQLYRLVK